MNEDTLKPKVGYGCQELTGVQESMNQSVREAAGFDVISATLSRMSGVIPTVKPNNIIQQLRNTANQQESNT